MARDINYSPEQYGGFSTDYYNIPWWCSRCKVNHYTPYCPISEYERLAKSWIENQWWCEKCLDYHVGHYDCPYEDNDYCPHCGQLMRIRK